MFVSNCGSVFVIAVSSALVIFSLSVNLAHGSSEGRNALPVEGNYTPTGTFYTVDNMSVYETVNKTSKRILIAAYDISGLNNNIQQIADKMAEGFGFKIIVPDYFRGQVCVGCPFDEVETNRFIAELGNWTVTAERDTRMLMDHYRQMQNATEFGIFGFCWGGYAATHAAITLPEMRGSGLVHPSLVANSDAIGVQIPMYLLPSRDEVNMLPFYATLQGKPFGARCGHRRFDDMAHAFAGMPGDFTDPLIALRVNEVIDILGNFFDRELAK